MKNFFTLIEVLVTMLIMTIIAALVIGAFHTGLMCYKKTSSFELPVLHTSSAVAVIKEDLRRFVPVSGDRISFEKNKMAFNIAVPDPESHLELIVYEVKNQRLERKASKYSDSDGGMTNTLTSTVLDDLENLTLSYESGPLPIEPDKKKDDKKDKKNKKCWPTLVKIQGELKGKHELETSLLFPLFNPPEAKDEKQ